MTRLTDEELDGMESRALHGLGQLLEQVAIQEAARIAITELKERRAAGLSAEELEDLAFAHARIVFSNNPENVWVARSLRTIERLIAASRSEKCT
jgi:hypothetical protein